VADTVGEEVSTMEGEAGIEVAEVESEGGPAGTEETVHEHS